PCRQLRRPDLRLPGPHDLRPDVTAVLARSIPAMKHTAILCLAVAAATPAAADDQPPSDTPPADNGKTEVISVTDTSIEHQLVTGRAPVTVVTRADLANSGHATLGDILQALPVSSNASNAQVNAGGDGTARINLRGLGAPRTLVLLNGRRIAYGGN